MAIVAGDVVLWHEQSDGSGTSTTDESGNGRSGTHVNTPAWTTTSLPSSANNALTFVEANSEEVTIADDADVQIGGTTEDWSFIIWLKAGPTNDNDGIAGRYLTKYPLYFSYNNAGKIACYLYDGSNNPGGLSVADVQDGNWHMYTIVRDGQSGTKTLKLYQDNNATPLINVTDTTTSSMEESTVTRYGQNPGTTLHLDGTIWQFIQFNKVLDTTEIASVYNSGSGILYADFFAGSGTNMQINIGDAWKTVEGMKINIGDTWKTVEGAQINIGDTWKTIF